MIEPAKSNTPHVDDTQSNTEVKVPVTSSVCANPIEHGSDTGAGEGECTMAIISVTVKLKNSVKSIVTYAFLVPGSSVTFCTDSLVDRIGATGRKAWITLNTMGEPYTMKTNMVSGIELCDLSSDNLIQLPRVYTRCIDVDNIPPERALGVYWTIESDSLSFRIEIRPHSTTRRGILSVVSSVYDPLGLAAPFVLPVKILLQGLCEQKLVWDDVISSAYIEKWHLWLKQLTNLEKLSVPRCLKPLSSHKTVSCEIHNFADASNVGYGMVSYLRFVDEQGRIHVSLLTGKSRVVPLKKITTPRMELTAATLAVRICNMTVNELEIAVNDTYYWTDSMSVLMYIRNEKTRFHTFVSNRLSVIHSGSEVEQWNYIDTASNPADDVSRGLVINDHTKVERWSIALTFFICRRNSGLIVLLVTKYPKVTPK